MHTRIFNTLAVHHHSLRGRQHCNIHHVTLQVTYEFNDKPMANLITNRILSRLYRQNAATVSVPVLADDDARLVAPSGSTDMGNVSHAVPSLHTHFYIGTDCHAHTRPFAQAAGESRTDQRRVSNMTTLLL